MHRLTKGVVACVGMTTAASLLAIATAEAQERPRIAVVGLVARDLAEESDAITEEIRATFVKSGCYVVVDRTLSDKIMDELALQQTGVTETDKAIKVSKLYTVKQIVSGKF